MTQTDDDISPPCTTSAPQTTQPMMTTPSSNSHGDAKSTTKAEVATETATNTLSGSQRHQQQQQLTEQVGGPPPPMLPLLSSNGLEEPSEEKTISPLGPNYSAEKQRQQQQCRSRQNPNERQVQKRPTDGNHVIKMKRTLNVWNGIAIIIGVIVGSGIFISPKGVLKYSGSVGASLLVWSSCGLLALMGALCFAELGTSIGSSGGEYTYIRLAYGPLPSFLYIWVLVLVIVPCSNAIAALTFANYCLQPLYDDSARPPEEAIRLLALAVLMLLIYINCKTVNGSISLQNTFTLAKVFALGLIIFYGLYYILTGNPFKSLTDRNLQQQQSPLSNQTTSLTLVSSSSSVSSPTSSDQTFNVSRVSSSTNFSTSSSSPSSTSFTGSHNGSSGEPLGWWTDTQTSLPLLARALYSGFFTYSGWNSLNAATEEIKKPVKNMPRAIIMSITFVTLIYILTNCAYFAVLDRQEILASDAIVVLFGDKIDVLSKYGLRWLMPMMVALSTVGGLNASIFAASRIYFAAAREGQLFGALAMINMDQLTPVPSLIFLGITSSFYLSTTKILSLIEYTTFVEATFAALGVSTMLALRFKMPNLNRPLRIPLIVPCIYLLFSAAMLILPLMTAPIETMRGVMIMLSGVPAYYLTARWQEKPIIYQKAIDKFNQITQMLTMSVLPTPDVQVKI